MATLKEYYDSNITYASSDTLDDFITLIKLGVEGKYEGKNQSLLLNASIKQQIFADNSSFNNFAQELNGVYKADLTPYDRLKIKNTFVHDEDPQDFEDQFGRASGRYDYYKNGFDSSWTHDFTKQFSMELKYRNNYYDPQRSDLVRSIQHKPGVEVDYAFTSWTSGLVYYDYTNRHYDGRGTVHKNSTGVGAKHFFTEQIYGDVKVGVDFIQPISGKDLTKPQFFVGLTDLIDERTTYGISYINDYGDMAYSQELFNRWQINMNWGKQLLERLNLLLSFFTGEGKYVNLGTSDRFTGAGFLLTYALTQDMDLTGGYSFSASHSNVDNQGFEKNLLSMQINVKF